MNKFDGVRIDDAEAEKILGEFRRRYINDSYPERILYINHLKQHDREVPFNRIRDIRMPKDKVLYMYHERLKTLYTTSFDQICTYVEQLEPWEDIDCLVFDEDMEWFLALTHDEKVLRYNI